MSENDKKIDDHVLQRLFNSDMPLVLYIGRKLQELSEVVINFPWSCVVTSQPGSDFAVKFREENKREVEELKTVTQIDDSVTLSRRYLKFINIYDADNTEELRRRKNKNAAEMLKLVTSRMRSGFGSLVIIGYDPTDEEELPSEKLTEIFDSMRKGSAFLFGFNVAEDENLTAAVNEGSLLSFEHPVEDYLRHFVEPDEWSASDGEQVFAEDDIVFFINKKPVSIESTHLFDTKGFCKLISTRELGDLAIPSGLQKEYFIKFLEDSVSLPMWFGFENDFNIRRRFEKELSDKVSVALKNVEDRESQGLIVLSGQTGSSKSIALAHLAFRIYQESVYPVIFIHDKNISLRHGDGNFNALEKLIHLLEQKGARTVLLIWDNSAAYTDPIPGTLGLLQDLRRRGRQCVLVSSAYMVDPTLSNASAKAGVRVEEVETDIDLFQEEVGQLRKKVLKLGSISEEFYDSWANSEKKQNLLTLLYRLFTNILGDSIAHGVRSEVSQTANTILGSISDKVFEKPDELNRMATYLMKAGFHVEHSKSSSVSVASSDRVTELLRIVAIASQFGVEFPLQFILTVAGLEAWEYNFYSTIKNLKRIPFLRLPERSEIDGSSYGQSILFRTPLEARLYLENSITAEDEINLVVKLIDALGDEHKHMEARALESLIRTMGPNSPLNRITLESRNITKYTTYYPRIIEALSRMRVARKTLIPRLMCQEVCWLREVFGKNNHITAVERLAKLTDAMEIADGALKKMRPGKLPQEEQNTRNSLIVERATSAWHIHTLRQAGSNSKNELTFDYEEHKTALEQVIRNAPNNSYAYNALLKLFIEMYKNTSLEEYAINELSNMLTMLESYEHVMGEVLYHEEFIDHKNEIMHFVSDAAVEDYFEELIKKGKSSGLYLWAKRRMMTMSINLDERVTKENYWILEEIVELFSKHLELVKTHSGCLFMLLRLKWQLFNHSPIFEHEKQFTQMNISQWKELADLCQGNCLSTQGNTAHLLYISALAEAQIGNYNESLSMQDKLNRVEWMPPRSTYVWHILSNEDGTPKFFNGRVEARDNFLRIADVREKNNNTLRISRTVFARSLHALQLNQPSGTYDDIEIGLNFKGFQAFRKLKGN